MDKFVYWIDEDGHLWSSERDAVSDFGYKVIPLENANSALEKFRSLGDYGNVQLIIMDVMLLAGEPNGDHHDECIYPSNRSGLELAEKLCGFYDGIGSKILFFSCASDQQHIAEIKLFAEKIGASYLPKYGEYRSLDFALKLKGMRLI